ncbi:LysR family transcriptional regulator [Rhodoplanes sp. Z2-YC6860]|uniref:LysR family transcriptional regulator n=1 Tax=Rhodoplanes sp. Z2-YC6860 TaxID=674703 RepID=UPI00078E7D21|nr:LysR family transcriptional regulator [Rhodoplanes sp. Z2-YC6860]AMN42033.1 LysR family transcriptional regulator [Rhodoplanes sp. Z2-YC6860]
MTMATARRHIKLQHLEILCAVAQRGSMGKAAKQLAVSQPVISKAITELEHRLAVQLFDRSPQGVEPTNYCRALLKRTVALLDDVDAAVQEIRFLGDPNSGELRIGSTEPLLAGIVAAAVESLWRDYPRVALHTIQADTATLLNRDLPERRVELAVIPIIGTKLRDDLEATKLYDDFWHVVAGADNPLVRRRKLTLADIADEPWCATPLDTTIGSLLIQAFRVEGLPPPRLRFSSVMSPMLVTRLLQQNRMLAVIADSLLSHFYAGRMPVKKLPVALRAPPFGVALVRLKNRGLTPVGEIFMQCAREVAKPLADRTIRKHG